MRLFLIILAIAVIHIQILLTVNDLGQYPAWFKMSYWWSPLGLPSFVYISGIGLVSLIYFLADVEFEKEEKSNTYDAAAVGLSNINPQVHEEEFLRHVDADSFTSIHNVNKVWSYKNMTDGCWTNFDCTDCIQIELAYSIYSKTFDDQFATVDLVVGQVSLKDDTLKVTDSSGHSHILDV